MIKLKNSISKLHKLVLITLLLACTIYAVIELSGKVKERTVSVGNATGRNFITPIHGEGLFTSDGFCEISQLPGFVLKKLIGASGLVFVMGLVIQSLYSCLFLTAPVSSSPYHR